MTDQRAYTLALSPSEAVELLVDSEAVGELYDGTQSVQGGAVSGMVTHGEDWVELSGIRADSFPVLSQFTARMRIELTAGENGTTFTLRKMPARLTAVDEFRSLAVVALASLIAAGYFSVPIGIIVGLIQIAIVGLVWLMNRRSVAAVNDYLCNIAWKAWAPALKSGPADAYRSLGPATTPE